MPTGTGVIAEIGTGDQVVGLRADIDALPIDEDTGLPFASTAAERHRTPAGTTCTYRRCWGRRWRWPGPGDLGGRVRLIFQPAEEVFPGGSHDVIAAGGLDGAEPAVCAALRSAGAGRPGRAEGGRDHLDVGLVELRVLGPGGHTSRPHLTADLVYALGTVITGLPALLDPAA